MDWMHWLTIGEKKVKAKAVEVKKVKAKAVEVNSLWQCNKTAAMEVNVKNLM
jgi:hypothetical protein